jgi:hypothetical protein
VYGGIRIEITIDDYPPDSSLELELLCPDFDPYCCPLWIPPEICYEKGNVIPMQWSIPQLDVLGLPEKAWFFIVCRDTMETVDLDNQLDSVAMDFDLSEPKFQWFDMEFALDTTYYYRVYAVDEAGNISDGSNVVSITTSVPYILGDATGDGLMDIDDVVYLVYFIFLGGPEPVPLWVGDVNCDGVIDIDDVVYLIECIFFFGPCPPALCD